MKHLAQKVDKEVRDLKRQLNLAEDCLEIANENGLLRNDSATYEKILNNISKARKNLNDNPPKIVEARKKFGRAYFHLNNAINSTSFWWRFKYSFGGPVLIYLLTILMSIFLSWILFSSILLNFKILWIPSWAYLWGSIGGVLQGFWWLWQHISNRCLRKLWFTWYIILPLMGAILGALTYLVFLAGFVVATGETQMTSESFVILLCALAGFSSRWAVKMLDKLTTIIQVGK